MKNRIDKKTPEMNIFSLQCCFTKTIKKEQRHQDNFHRPSAEYWRKDHHEALQGAQAFTARALRQGLMWRNKRKTEDGAAHRNERSVRLTKFKCLGPAPLLCRGESPRPFVELTHRRSLEMPEANTSAHNLQHRFDRHSAPCPRCRTRTRAPCRRGLTTAPCPARALKAFRPPTGHLAIQRRVRGRIVNVSSRAAMNAPHKACANHTRRPCRLVSLTKKRERGLFSSASEG